MQQEIGLISLIS